MKPADVRAEALKLYADSSVTMREIADRLRVSEITLKRWANAAGVKARGSPRKKRTIDERENFARMYREGKKWSEISAELGISKGQLIRWRAQMGLTTRTAGSAEKIKSQRAIFEQLYATTPLGLRAVAKKIGVSVKTCRPWMRDIRARGVPEKKAAESRLFSGTRQASSRSIWAGWWPEQERGQRALIQIDRTFGTGRRSYHDDIVASRAYGAAAARRRHARLKNTPEWKIRAAARNAIARIARMVRCRRNPKTRTFEFLGCDYAFARAYLNARLLPGMTWENHGTVWEIDHVIPISSFDLLDERQRKKALHFTNLQPLFKQDNRKKSAKVARQEMLAI